jgi:hypothetical protein
LTILFHVPVLGLVFLILMFICMFIYFGCLLIKE